MTCEICGSGRISVTFDGPIRDGAPGRMTGCAVQVYRCEGCGCMWHGPIAESAELYQTDAYRESMGEKVALEDFYAKHDIEIIDKLNYTGSEVYRNKLFMDIGCGGGGYADYINSVAKKVVLAEPNESFASQLRQKGYEVFAYPEDALSKYGNRIELITTYDVIEHVDDPLAFVRTIYELLAPGGTALIGTPTEYPVLRGLLGAQFDAFVFSVQHPWVFSRKSLELIAQKSGFTKAEVGFYQRFGLGNLIAWLQNRKPCGDKQYSFITDSLNALYKSEMAKEETAEYLVLKVTK